VSGQTVLLVTDTIVFSLYGEKVTCSLDRSGYRYQVVVLPPGEQSKEWRQAERVYNAALAAGLERQGSFMIALGGGVVGDLTGFAAATYLRGVPYIQVPTTLLAQVDSSVGGKVAVNIPAGKNLVGVFYHPAAVVIDPETLASLPDRDLISGLAEVVKYGIIYDREFFARLESLVPRLLAKDFTSISEVISRCIEIKRDVVNMDEREQDQRRILNFGHTLGHALERETGYGYYRHGEAVAAGMVMAVEIAVRLGLTGEEDAARMRSLIGCLPVPPPLHATAEGLLSALTFDKKRRQGRTVFVLPLEIGMVECRDDIPLSLVEQVVCDYLADRGKRKDVNS